MSPGYIHVEVETAQSSKRVGSPCGDVVLTDRNVAATTLICADGIGSGIRAHLAAEMCARRLRELLRLGFSLRKAFATLTQTMENSRDPSKPYAVFTVARILNDGMATILSYEMPRPLLVSRRHASTLPFTNIELGGTLVQESNCYLEAGDGLLVMSDGITQAGLGTSLTQGWQSEGVVRFLNDQLTDGLLPKEIPSSVHQEARRLWHIQGDDCTVAMALCRRGLIVNLLTGPSASEMDDTKMVRRFVQSEGIKIVCGGTTSKIVARVLKQHLSIEPEPKSLIAPPRFEIPGIDLVTEGAITLNQVYNVLDENLENLTEDSGVTELCSLLQIADRVNIFWGSAKNRAADNISFRQQGILSRERIIFLLEEKLRAMGKLVVIEKH